MNLLNFGLHEVHRLTCIQAEEVLFSQFYCMYTDVLIMMFSAFSMHAKIGVLL